MLEDIDIAKKGKSKKIKSLWSAAQNNAIRTNNVKAKID